MDRLGEKNETLEVWIAWNDWNATCLISLSEGGKERPVRETWHVAVARKGWCALAGYHPRWSNVVRCSFSFSCVHPISLFPCPGCDSQVRSRYFRPPAYPSEGRAQEQGRGGRRPGGSEWGRYRWQRVLEAMAFPRPNEGEEL